MPLLLQKLERRPYEFIVGSRMDPVFGTVAIVGAGGILAEQLGDVVVAVAPFESHEIVERLR
ncbi:acetate--CoA ligase family protein, partial [Stenotrophomonas maltophilia]|uniref:acetate--CoA ligase family protein n=1 Tax=Stenotrophomonas maltophilia TaxID=40324 RepID=UPI0013DC3AE9